MKEAIHVDPNMPNGPANIIAITLEPKYKVRSLFSKHFVQFLMSFQDPNANSNNAESTAKAPRITKKHFNDSDDESALTDLPDDDEDKDADEEMGEDSTAAKDLSKNDKNVNKGMVFFEDVFSLFFRCMYTY